MEKYKQGDSVRKALELLESQKANKPGEYQSKWQNDINGILGKIKDRKPFQYDVNGDSMYQMYKDAYTKAGRRAMKDTMGQATALTGGYANSWAQSAGQQAFGRYMEGLADKVPQLQQLAFNMYQQEGNDMKDLLGILSGQEERDYAKHRQGVADWQAGVDRLQNQYNQELNFDYGKYRDAVADQQREDALAYQKEQDAKQAAQWQQNFDENKRQFDAQLTLSQQRASRGGGGGGGYDNDGYDKDAIIAAQEFLGVTADGMFGPASKKAMKKAGYDSIEEVLEAMEEEDDSYDTTVEGFGDYEPTGTLIPFTQRKQSQLDSSGIFAMAMNPWLRK